jgi:peptidoglycan/xylan/chitin deacetylase (PgdA/CDA1 family)
VALWNVDTQDWRSGAKVKGIVRRATGAPAGSIILMHCARDASAKALPFIIRHYQRRGLEPVGLSELLPPANE